MFTYPEVQSCCRACRRWIWAARSAAESREAAILARSYRGYVWSQWFGQNLIQLWAIFAVLLGTGGLLSQTSGGGGAVHAVAAGVAPRAAGVRAATGLAEMLVLALVPSLVLPLLSPAIGQSYSLGDALVHALCLFVAGAVFFSLAFLLSTVFSDVWRPLLFALCAAAILALAEQFFDGLSRYGVIRVMSGESYFRGGGLPWLGLLVSAALSVAMLYGAVVNVARRDF